MKNTPARRGQVTNSPRGGEGREGREILPVGMRGQADSV